MWGWHVNLGEVDWHLIHVRLLIPCFLVAQIVSNRSKTQRNQAKTPWRIAMSSSVAASVRFLSRKKKEEIKIFVLSLSLILILRLFYIFASHYQPIILMSIYIVAIARNH